MRAAHPSHGRGLCLLLVLVFGCQKSAQQAPPTGPETATSQPRPDAADQTPAGPSGPLALRLEALQIPVDDPFVEVSLSRQMGCARRQSGRIACWRSEDPVLREIADVADATSISTQADAVCAIRGPAHTLQCWDVVAGSPSPYTTRPELDGVAWLAHAPVAHGRSSCAGLTTGETVCWEWEALSTEAIRERLSLPTGLTGLTFGWSHWCGLMADDTMQCWGGNGRGQLGPGARKAPMPSADWIPEADVRGAVAPVAGVRSTATGHEFTCAAVASGEVHCWGTDYEGVLGDGPTTADVGVAVRVAHVSDVVQIDAGSAFACAREADGDVWCWGANYYGQLGEGSTAHHRTEPIQLAGFSATDIDLYWDKACATTAKGHVVCWGNHDSPIQPRRVRDLARVEELTACADGTCARRDDGEVLCWGNFVTGSEKDPRRFRDPTPVASATGYRGLTAFCDGDEWRVCGQSQDDLRCLVSNALGDAPAARTLAEGGAGRSSIHLSHITGTPWPCVVDSQDVSCWNGQARWPLEGAPGHEGVRDMDIHGDTLCWVTDAGLAECGEIERDDDRDRLVLEDRRPQPLLSDLVEISSTTVAACARDSGQRVYCWPLLSNGGPELAAEGIATLGPPGCGITTRGEARCWERPFGSTPESAGSNATAMVVGSQHGCVLHRDRTVSCWGDNGASQLGDGRGGGSLWGVATE